MKTATKGRRKLAIAVLVVGVTAIGSIGACTYQSHMGNSAFNAVQVGDTEATVIARFGAQPSVRENPPAFFSRYASHPCNGECVERLWFENRLVFDTEAWSVELDKNSQVIKKSRWISP